MLLLSLWKRTDGGLLLSSAQEPEEGYCYPSGQGPVEGCSEQGNKSSDPIKFLSCEFVDIRNGVHEHPFFKTSSCVGG